MQISSPLAAACLVLTAAYGSVRLGTAGGRPAHAGHSAGGAGRPAHGRLELEPSPARAMGQGLADHGELGLRAWQYVRRSAAHHAGAGTVAHRSDRPRACGTAGHTRRLPTRQPECRGRPRRPGSAMAAHHLGEPASAQQLLDTAQVAYTRHRSSWPLLRQREGDAMASEAAALLPSGAPAPE